jgi:hypothetical protein
MEAIPHTFTSISLRTASTVSGARIGVFKSRSISLNRCCDYGSHTFSARSSSEKGTSNLRRIWTCQTSMRFTRYLCTISNRLVCWYSDVDPVHRPYIRIGLAVVLGRDPWTSPKSPLSPLGTAILAQAHNAAIRSSTVFGSSKLKNGGRPMRSGRTFGRHPGLT